MRNVWRAPIRDAFSSPDHVFRNCNDSYAFGHTCPPDHSGRNVWRASPFESAGFLGPLLRPLGPAGSLKGSGAVPPGARLGPDVAPKRLLNLTSTCPRLHPDLWSGIFCRRKRHAHEVARRHRAGSGDRENPMRAGAKGIPGLPVKTGLP